MLEIEDLKIEKLKKFLNEHSFFYIAGHKEPDGDCVSSCLGMAELVKKFNKPYQLISAGPFKRIEIQKYADLFSSEMQFLSDSERKQTGLIICDCSEIKRLGEIDGDFNGLDTFIIDHHKTSECPENAESIIDSTSPSASFLVQIVYEKIIGEIPEELAKILFFGSMTDTGFFKFLKDDSAKAFEAVSRLVKAGANPRTTYDEMTSGKAWNTRKLLGLHMNHAEKYLNGKLILTYETMDDTRKFGQEGRDSDALYSSLLAVEGVEAVAFIRQDTENTCTAGLRSRDSVDVSAVASKFGGGGHKNASGLSCDGKLDTLIPQIVKEFAKIIK